MIDSTKLEYVDFLTDSNSLHVFEDYYIFYDELFLANSSQIENITDQWDEVVKKLNVLYDKAETLAEKRVLCRALNYLSSDFLLETTERYNHDIIDLPKNFTITEV
jgi:hypothetical protein